MFDENNDDDDDNDSAKKNPNERTSLVPSSVPLDPILIAPTNCIKLMAQSEMKISILYIRTVDRVQIKFRVEYKNIAQRWRREETEFQRRFSPCLVSSIANTGGGEVKREYLTFWWFRTYKR